MDDPLHPDIAARDCEPADLEPRGPEESLSTLDSLLEHVDDGAAAPQSTPESRPQSTPEEARQNELVQVRLGIASSLFTSLRAKHAPTAAHSLRVALGCSSWARAMCQSASECDEIEVAALLHDIGKIGVPDHVLLKPGPLSDAEVALMARHRQTSLDILASCCASREIQEIIQYTPAWYDGSKPGFDRSGEQLPMRARMVSIVDAFDAMTTDHVYRKAMAHERAVAELFRFAGTQFDPQRVREFCTLLEQDQIQLNESVGQRWLQRLTIESANTLWHLIDTVPQAKQPSVDNLFLNKLLDNMHDGVVFVDTSLRILLWNCGAERLTGIAASSVFQKRWLPSLVTMRDENFKIISDSECPVDYAVRTGMQSLRRLTIAGRNDQQIPVDAHAVPVVGSDGTTYGAILVLNDVSSEASLEERVQRLHEKASKDPLTQVANRAEFDRVLEQFVEAHIKRGFPCSLIFCDIDHFKRINDKYGHQAGDKALTSIASLLKRSCRSGDLVARYGGEEFVLLCADCDNATASARAEEIRRELSEYPQPMLYGHRITSSFGVTEVQGGDTPETTLRRADRALSEAKSLGRNKVVQLGTGIGNKEKRQARGWWPSWQRTTADTLIQRHLVTTVPMNVVVEKLRGFVSDHHAEIESDRADEVVIVVDAQRSPQLRRQSDRPMPFVIEISLSEHHVQPETQSDSHGGKVSRTQIDVAIRPKRNRDRRQRDAMERAGQLLVSLKAYLMAQESTEMDRSKKG